MVVETTGPSDGLEAPAITFCRRGPEEVLVISNITTPNLNQFTRRAGWKQANKQTDLLKTFCNENGKGKFSIYLLFSQRY